MIKFRFPCIPSLSASHRQPRISIRLSSGWLLTAVYVCLLSGHLIAHAQTIQATNYTRQQLIAIAEQMRAEPVQAGHSRDAIERHLDNGTILAVRTSDGRAELHTSSADEFFVVAGQAELVTGGTIVNPQGSAEVRGDSIAGGAHADLAPGDVVYIPPQTPHQLLFRGAAPFVYVLIKLPAN
jgi:mannose-6-phosphate isomerase-like protein (cupin superfamily)